MGCRRFGLAFSPQTLSVQLCSLQSLHAFFDAMLEPLENLNRG
jgi:hypothetical protein